MTVDGKDVDNQGPLPYEVGYGRPPVDSRFKKGRSGNPKGRPKKRSKPIGELLLDAFNKPVTVILGGRETTVEAAKALLINLTLRAIKGETRLLRKIGMLLHKSRLLQPVEDPDRPTGVVFMTEEEISELHAHPERLLEIVRRSRERQAAKAPPVETARLSAG